MAANNSLQYLSGIASMEIRAYTSNDDKLLEMVAGDFRTICWKDQGSHDLVIKDLAGNSKFCIGGGEIKKHPILVYYSENNIIGEIKDGKLRHSTSDGVEPISVSANKITVAGNTFETFHTHTAIIFNSEAVVEMRAMVIALAAQETLTDKFLQKNLPIGLESKYDVSNSLIIPKQNKQTVAAIFTDEGNNQTYILKMGGRQGENNIFALLLMDNSERHSILLTITVKAGMMSASNLVGEKQYTTARDASVESKLIVSSDSTTIGEVYVYLGAKTHQASLTTYSSPSNSTMNVHGDMEKGKIVDSVEFEVATYKRSCPISFEITLKELTKNQKKLVSAYFSAVICKVLTVSQYSANMMITMLSCNCSICQLPQHAGSRRQVLRGLDFINGIRSLTLSLTGHSSDKNLLYLNLHVHSNVSSHTELTLECTPISGFQGFAQFHAKDRYGKLLFKAAILPDEDILAVYTHEDNLLGYFYRENGIDDENNTVFKIQKTAKYLKQLTTSQFTIVDLSTSRRLATINGQHFYVQIYKPERITTAKFFKLAMIISFATKIFFHTFKFDLHPSPEISYRYKGSTRDAKRVALL